MQNDPSAAPATPPSQALAHAPQHVADFGLQLSAALKTVVDNKPSTGLTLGFIIDETGERAFGVLMAFLCIPFLIPMIPGVSTPFGLALMMLGAQLAIGWHRPWLPKKLRNWKLPDKLTTSILSGVAKLFRPLEKIIRPRAKFMQNRISYVIIGVALAIHGALLALPIPLPATNIIPAWMALILILGITEEDGVTMIIGLILTGAAIAAVVIGLVWGIEYFKERKNHADSKPAATQSQPATQTRPATAAPVSQPAQSQPLPQ